ncbi:MAG TPA: ABC transporter ATP-binding protein [Rariglobus sp.]|jgi:subfamily B ATP-binding cassette protein MsbA|nr:ABC transporter ATP-binding protein [Rariglobus sp.]
MRRFLPYYSYVKPVRWQLGLGLLCGLIYSVASGFGLPYMVKYIFPKIFTDSGSHPSALQIALIAAWLPAVFTIRGIAGYLNTYLTQYAGTRILEQLRLDYFRKLQFLPLSFLQKNSTGDLISRGVADTNQLQTTLSNLANDIIKQPGTLVAAIGYLIWLAYRQSGVGLVLVCLASVPLCVLPIRYAGNRIRRRAMELQAQLGSLTGRFSENLASAREVRAFCLEERETVRFGKTTHMLLSLQMKVVKYAKAITPAIEIISAFGLAATFIYAYRAGLTQNDFISIITALYVCYEPIKKLGALSNDTKRGAAALERLEHVLKEPILLTDPAQPVEVSRLHGDLAFENLSFTYKGDTPALRDVSITIPAGTTCALVGPSGAGKTTFANLVLRFYDATAGRVTIDGIDVKAMRLADLRRNIALVSQDPVLFNDTIYNNLLLGRQDATQAEVEQAAKDAFAHDFILSLPQGYETMVGERGASLSGGQRQRIAIARAFLRNAPILVLDEATSALDGESEAAIQLALKKLVVGKTVLIIAHRFSTIRDASMILVFENGEIIDSANHTILYERNALYKSLYDRQGTS